MTEENQSPALFQDRSQELMAQADAAAVARATQEIQAALVIGMRNPRNEVRAEARIMQACSRKGLAEVAEYEYNRGGTRIVGPTIDLLRAIANRWGNLLYGWAETDRKDGASTVRCWAWDTQFNSRAERTFVVRHWRDTKGGGYALEDERDIYELLANMASRRVRACLEEIIDADILEKAIERCRKTMREGEKTPIRDRAAGMINAFAEFGVTASMIEDRLGNNLESISHNQLASLLRVHKALKDGVGQREDYFKPSVQAPKFEEKEKPQQPAAAPAPAPEEAPPMFEPEPEPPKTQPAKAQAPGGQLRLLRDMLKVSKIKEAKLLEFLYQTGSTDGSQGTLEELQLANPEIIAISLKNFADIAKKIKAVD